MARESGRSRALREHAEGIAQELARRSRPLLVGIDGPGGSGKSTLAGELAGSIGATVVEADDFYLPAGKRAADPGIGGDYDWRRLEWQVLVPLAAGEPARYRRYDWDRDELAEWHEVPPEPPVIVEGVYVLRRELRRYFTCTVWVHAPRELRLRRGIARDGEAARDRWLRWMAREDRYVATQQPHLHADLVVPGWARE